MLAAGLPDWTGNGTGVAGWPEPGQAYLDPAGGTLILVLTAPRWPGVLRCNGVAMLTARPLPCGFHARPPWPAIDSCVRRWASRPSLAST